jgi:hypothetical protein
MSLFHFAAVILWYRKLKSRVGAIFAIYSKGFFNSTDYVINREV